MSVHLSLLVASALFLSVDALTCYVNDNQGNVYERTNESWRYCQLIPFASSNGGGRLNGVGEANESLVGYDALFGQNTQLYKVLVTCILEKYSFNEVNPAFGPAPEYMFRCFCNSNRCNKESTFSKFLSAARN